MWIYLVILVVAIAAVLGGALAGGIFTIVLIPLAVIALGSAIAYAMWGRSAEAGSGARADASHEPDRPLPAHTPRDPGRVTASPEALADARRARQ